MNGKAKDNEGCQEKILKFLGYILIPHMHKILNIVLKQGFPKTWNRSLIVPIFKIGDKNNPSIYRTIMIRHLLANLYGIILDNKINV